MSYKLNLHQIKKIAELAGDEFDKTYATYKGDVDLIKEYSGLTDLDLFLENRTQNSFKEVLLERGLPFSSDRRNVSHAFLGLNICDVHALHLFLKNFQKTTLMPRRENILIVATECTPDKNCFCHALGTNKLIGYDIYIEKDGENYALFTATNKGEDFVERLNLKQSSTPASPRPIKDDTDIDEDNLTRAIENKEKFRDIWEKIANNCFSCGACSSVCPLCFCFSREEKNSSDGESCDRICPTSCFNKEFFTVQNNVDTKPGNSDRIYNWYHHKFVRGKKDLGRFLCTGCGRCIEACPANLNIKNILSSLDHQLKNILDEKSS